MAREVGLVPHHAHPPALRGRLLRRVERRRRVVRALGIGGSRRRTTTTAAAPLCALHRKSLTPSGRTRSAPSPGCRGGAPSVSSTPGPARRRSTRWRSGPSPPPLLWRRRPEKTVNADQAGLDMRDRGGLRRTRRPEECGRRPDAAEKAQPKASARVHWSTPPDPLRLPKFDAPKACALPRGTAPRPPVSPARPRPARGPRRSAAAAPPPAPSTLRPRSARTG